MNYKSRWLRIIPLIGLAILLINSCDLLNEVVIPSATATATNTPILFKLGDPTATPLGSEITDSNYIKGIEALNVNNYEEALVFLNSAIETNPNLAPPYQYRGLAHWALGDCVSALADEEKALSINPDYAAAWARRGLAHFCLGNDEQALDDLRKALALDPSLAFVHHNLGFYYYEQGNYEKSLNEYGLSVAIDPYRSAAWAGKAEALTQLGRYSECIVNATKAIDANPNAAPGYNDRAYCELLTNDFLAAIEDYKKFLEYEPTNVSAWNNLGTSQHRVGLLQDALVSLNKALELDPTFYQSSINRGLVLTDLGNHGDALNDFNDALEFEDVPNAYSGRGTVYYYLGRYEEAITDLELSIQMEPNRLHRYCTLSFAYAEVGRYQDVIDAEEKVNQIAPGGCGGAKLFEVVAQSYYELGEFERGIEYITHTFEDKAVFMLGYYYRGIMYDSIEKKQEAIKDLEFFLASSTSIDVLYKEQAADAKERLARLKP